MVNRSSLVVVARPMPATDLGGSDTTSRVIQGVPGQRGITAAADRPRRHNGLSSRPAQAHCPDRTHRLGCTSRRAAIALLGGPTSTSELWAARTGANQRAPNRARENASHQDDCRQCQTPASPSQPELARLSVPICERRKRSSRAFLLQWPCNFVEQLELLMQISPVRAPSPWPPEPVRPSEVTAHAIFFALFLILFSMFLIIVYQIGDVVYHRPLAGLISGARRLAGVVTAEMLVFTSVSLPIVWCLLRFFLTRSLVVLTFQLGRTKALLKLFVRVLGTLPTVILGNVFLTAFYLVGYSPSTEAEAGLLLLVTIIIVALPTALQVGQEILDDCDKSSLQHARSLGLSNLAAGYLVVLPQYRKSLNVCVTFSLGRIIVELYIILAGSAYGLDLAAMGGIVNDIFLAF